MKSIKFLSICFSLSFLFCLSYFILVDSYVFYKRTVPETYKQFLLEGFADYQGKIILIGGSDVHHGINALEMERHFNMPVINLGDWAVVPLKHKILHLKKYLKPGDIVILSLGWHWYFEEELLEDEYVKAIIDSHINGLSTYYMNLPFYEKVQLVFSDFPYEYVLTAIFNRPSSLEIQNRNFKAIKNFKKTLDSDKADARGSSILNEWNNQRLIVRSNGPVIIIFFPNI